MTFIVAKTSNKKDFQILNNVIFERFLYSNVLKNGENIVPLQLKWPNGVIVYVEQK